MHFKNSKITIKDIDLVVSTGSTHKDIQKKSNHV